MGYESRARESGDDRPVLVTGGAGFIGSHVCHRLVRDGRQAIAVDDLSLGRPANFVQLIGDPLFAFEQLDLARDADRLRELIVERDVGEIWHLAANSDIALGSRDRGLDFERTFLTSARLLEAASWHDVRRVVFASSSAVFGESDLVLAENSGPLQPVSFYGAAKLASEAYVSAYAHRMDIDAWIYRFPNVVGAPATHGVIHDFVKKIRATGRLEVLGNGTQTKPYLHVDDLVEGMSLGLSHRAGRVNTFHLAGHGLTSVRDIAHWVAEALDLPQERIEFGDADRGWPGDVPRFEYDCSKIRGLGWKPERNSDAAVRQAIAEIVEKETACCARP